ncbi:hypothetical protein N865_14425 [Intrasporangium oryzae NRRL B-24470]|uniref:Uncharacterized protein n=2 Tax=Intrasporangium TaxID=53357 RepID=W9G6X1_9MICO|nr:hypothetical protein N865_14425 [Intrasporangium oryzae NRRL B-24470]
MMLVDCQTCPVRDVHCADCVVTALASTGPAPGSSTGFLTRSPTRSRAGSPPGSRPESSFEPTPDSLPLDRAERRAVSVLLAAGLVSHDTAHAARAVRDAPARQRVPAARRAAV